MVQSTGPIYCSDWSSWQDDCFLREFASSVEIIGSNADWLDRCKNFSSNNYNDYDNDYDNNNHNNNRKIVSCDCYSPLSY